MAGSERRYPSDQEVSDLIRIKARVLAGKLRVPDEQRQDWEQQMFEHYLEIRDQHDPELSEWRTFLNRVFDNQAINLTEEWFTAKRKNERRARRWDDEIGENEEGSFTLADVYSQAEHFNETGWGPPPAESNIDLQMDVESVLRRLPPDLRELAERLMHQSVTDAAQEVGIPRTTLYGRLERLAKALREAGLDDSQPPQEK